MCFYTQKTFACGDWAWGNFQAKCKPELRMGETCGMKFVHNVETVQLQCRVCEKIDVKDRRRKCEKKRVARWMQLGSVVRASIEKSLAIIRDLEQEISALEHEREVKRIGRPTGTLRRDHRRHSLGAMETTSPDGLTEFHSRERRTHYFTCIFQFAGCEAGFSSKEDWKRHVTEDHVRFDYYVCPFQSCAEKRGNDIPKAFRCRGKENYEHHIRKNHMHLAGRGGEGISAIAGGPSTEKVFESEDYVRRRLQIDYDACGGLPTFMACPKQSCGQVFRGVMAWEVRMEHVALHMEWAAQGLEEPLVCGGDRDPTLMDWATRPDVAIVKMESGRWVINGSFKSPMTATAKQASVRDRCANPTASLSQLDSAPLLPRDSLAPATPVAESAIGSVARLTNQLTDSGYASLRMDPAHPGTTNPANAESAQTADDADDAATVYSSTLSLAEDQVDIYKSEFAEALAGDLRSQTQDPRPLQSLFSRLPTLLKAFALRLGCAGSNKAERDVMCFIHKHRSGIADRFKDAVKESSEGDVEEAQESKHRLDMATVSSNIWRWLESIGDYDKREDNLRKPNQDDGQQPDWHDEFEERPRLPDKRGYDKVISKSVAYQWLIASLSKELLLAPLPAEDDVCGHVRSEVLSCLERCGTVSSKRASERHVMKMLVGWNPVDFLRNEFGSPTDLGRLLGETITLTGSATDAQALPCARYLCQTWPVSGPRLFSLLASALESGRQISGELPDTSLVELSFVKPHLHVRVEGTSDSIAEIAEQIGWLGAAIRASHKRSGVSISSPRIRTFPPPKHGDSASSCVFEFLIDGAIEYPDNRDGQCWHLLFRNPVVVRGYPIPRRERYNSGLEIPLNMMSGLSESPRLNEFLGSYFLKGFSTAIVPTEKLDDAILWHLYCSRDGSRLPYPDPGSLSCPGIGRDDLVKGRHILGWCTEARFHAGAQGMNYAIGPSRLSSPGKDFSLEKVTFSVGHIVTGGCQFAIGRKDTPVRISRSGYIAKLRWIRQKYVTLWDVAENRGWLIDGVSVLLHLLRASFEVSRTDKFSSEFLFDEAKFQEPTNPFQADTALEVLLNRDNRSLDLYPKDEKTGTEERVLANGQIVMTPRTVVTTTTVQDRVEELYESLEKLIDHNATAEAAYKGVNAKPRLRDRIEGWDFADLAGDRDPFYLKTATLPLHVLNWVDFTRAIPAVTLFGRGFGDIIRASPTPNHRRISDPRCLEWTTVPKDQYYLCVSVTDLRDIIERMGDTSASPVVVAPGILWRNPFKGNPFERCVCTRTQRDNKEKSSVVTHPIQELLPVKMKFAFGATGAVDLMANQAGAVIFGAPGRKWSWPSFSGVEGQCADREASEAMRLEPADISPSLETTSTTTTTSDVDTSLGLIGDCPGSSSPPTTASSGYGTAMDPTSGREPLNGKDGADTNDPAGWSGLLTNRKRRKSLSDESPAAEANEEGGEKKRRKLLNRAMSYIHRSP